MPHKCTTNVTNGEFFTFGQLVFDSTLQFRIKLNCRYPSPTFIDIPFAIAIRMASPILVSRISLPFLHPIFVKSFWRNFCAAFIGTSLFAVYPYYHIICQGTRREEHTCFGCVLHFERIGYAFRVLFTLFFGSEFMLPSILQHNLFSAYLVLSRAFRKL